MFPNKANISFGIDCFVTVSGCTKLARVYLSDKMIIEKDAFRGCEFITFYLYADKIPDGYGDGWMPPNSVVLLAKEAK